MANGNAALEDSEQDDFGIPGSDEADTGAAITAPTPAPQPVQATQPSPSPQTPQSGPKVSGKAAFLGNLLKTLLSGVQNAQGNPNNAFDRGFQNASPQAQQAKQANISKLQSEADREKALASVAGAQAIIYKGLVQQLPQKLQNEHMDAIDN